MIGQSHVLTKILEDPIYVILPCVNYIYRIRSRARSIFHVLPSHQISTPWELVNNVSITPDKIAYINIYAYNIYVLTILVGKKLQNFSSSVISSRHITQLFQNIRKQHIEQQYTTRTIKKTDDEIGTFLCQSHLLPEDQAKPKASSS